MLAVVEKSLPPSYSWILFHWNTIFSGRDAQLCRKCSCFPSARPSAANRKKRRAASSVQEEFLLSPKSVPGFRRCRRSSGINHSFFGRFTLPSKLNVLLLVSLAVARPQVYSTPKGVFCPFPRLSFFRSTDIVTGCLHKRNGGLVFQSHRLNKKRADKL